MTQSWSLVFCATLKQNLTLSFAHFPAFKQRQLYEGILPTLAIELLYIFPVEYVW